ncbi:hypothetical protein SEPCBS119000_000884 [Sporothrix epigloea]|uniref:Pathway-specific nitrogen regulator n=1 Tax=Sporothrix epigloea TaxID=1892477 RepID=A0ABP0D7P1_9PEZI
MADGDEIRPGEAVLEAPALDIESDETQPALPDDEAHDTNEAVTGELAPKALICHSEADIWAADDATLEEPHELKSPEEQDEIASDAITTEPIDVQDTHQETDVASSSAALIEQESLEDTEAAPAEAEEGQDQSHFEDEQVDLDPTDDSPFDKTQPTSQESRRSSASSYRSEVSERRTSLRTEALIQAAARAVVAKINDKNSTDDDFDITSAMSESHEDSQYDYHQHAATDEEGEYDHEENVEIDNDDVFSDRSPRSSLGSFEHNSGASSNGVCEDLQKVDHCENYTTSHAEIEDEHDLAEETTSVAYHDQVHDDRHRPPRLSSVSGISHMSHYEQFQDHDEEEYDNGVAAFHQSIRGPPRAAFRTPSSVRAIQMSSPSPSVIFGVSPRSAARRRRIGTGSGVGDGQSMGSVGTTSSLPGSPSKSHTPTRFKVFSKPEPAPLVLLHATVMPTRWAWSDVLRTLDEQLHTTIKHGRDGLPSCQQPSASPFEPSAALKRLYGAWCRLQEYSFGSDTVAERGVLLPHPQNDYEVLEEKLLEALELPVRRRARILECGHYLGPADEDDDDLDDESDDLSDRRPSYRDESGSPKRRHWCTTCRSEISFESLGAERVYRVKVYASNGLMTVGAWAACWSEMERVDVEIEPIVADAELLRELNQLRALQQHEALREQEEKAGASAAAAAVAALEIESDDHDNHEKPANHVERKEVAQSPAFVRQSRPATPSADLLATPLRDSSASKHINTTSRRSTDSERRQREAEERLREIYGETPPQARPFASSASSSRGLDTSSFSGVPETTMFETTQDLDGDHSLFEQAPPSPSTEGYGRREKRLSHQSSTSRHGGHIDEAGEAASFGFTAHPHQPQTPYDSASLLELLVAAGKVFIRDRKHVAITVLSILVILLASLRAPSAEGADMTAAVPLGRSNSVVHQVPVPHLDAGYKRPAGQNEPAVVVGPMMKKAASFVLRDTLVETVTEKMTVKVFETVTATATFTAISAATTNEGATTTAVSDLSMTETINAVTAEALDIAESVESALVAADKEPLTTTPALSLTAMEEAKVLFVATCASGASAEPSPAYENESNPIES